MANVIKAFKYNIELYFNADVDESIVKSGDINIGSFEHIDSNFIKYMLIEYLYTSNEMPIIYLSLAVKNDIYEKIIKNEKNGKFYLKLHRNNQLSKNAIYKKTIDNAFNYILSSSNPNYSANLESETSNADVAYRQITVALLDMDNINAARAQKDEKNGILVSGIFGKIDTDTIIQKTMEGLSDNYHMPQIIQPPTHNTTFDTIVIPPMNKRRNVLDYLFNKSPFYDTMFNLFFDFNRVYLLDMSGEGIKVDDGSKQNIIFSIEEVTSDNAYNEGIIESDSEDAYLIYINPANANITPNDSRDKVVNKLVTIDEKGEVDAVSINSDVVKSSQWNTLSANGETGVITNSENGETIGTTTVSENYAEGEEDIKYTFKRGGNAVLYKNILESDTVTIQLTKLNLDGAIFTPNKTYYIRNMKGYTKYNGKYLLVAKRETFRNNNGDFMCLCEFDLRKIGNINDISTASVDSGSTDVGTSGTHSTEYQSNYYVSATNAGDNTTVQNGITRLKYPTANMSARGKTSAPDPRKVKAKTETIEKKPVELKRVKRVGPEMVNTNSAGPVRRVYGPNFGSLNRKF